MTRFWPILVLIVIVFAVGAIVYSLYVDEDASLAGRDRVVFQLQWTPQSQFVGFYVAKAKGFFAEEGLTVDFLHGGPDVDPIKNVTNGEAQIGLATADQVLVWTDQNSSPQQDLKAIGTVFNKSIAGFMSRKSLGISTPEQLRGKKLVCSHLMIQNIC